MAILASASSFVFSTASSYVFGPEPPPPPLRRNDNSTASTSSSTPSTLAEIKKSRRNSTILLPSSSSNNLNFQFGSNAATKEGEELCKKINLETDLYKILGVNKKVKLEEIRKAFLNKSKIIHPDKLPHYSPSTPAFQRLSFAYETLSKPASRRMYDLGGGRGYDVGSAREAPSAGLGDETLHGVLRSVFTEFLAGDFEMIRVFFNAINDSNPGLNLGDEAVDNLEGAFQRIRHILLTGQKYLNLLKFELIRLYEIQNSLRSLSYLDLVGRLRLTLALTRVTLEIPLVLDRAMRSEESNGRNRGKRRRKKGKRKKKEEEKVNGVNGNSNGKEKMNGNTTSEEEETTIEEGEGSEEEDGVEYETDSETEEESSTTTNDNNENSSTTPNSNTNFDYSSGGGELQSRGLLGPRVKGVLVLACKVLEKGERFGV